MKKMILTLLCGLSLCAVGRADDYRNVQFYTGYGNVRWNLLTHLVYLDFSNIDTNTHSFIPHTPEEITLITNLRDEARERNKIFMLCYAKGFPEVKPMLEDGTKRAAYIAAIANIASTHDLDGIDIDYEYPYTTYETDLLNVFFTELRAALGTQRLLSADVGHGLQISANMINDHLDWIQTMNYQYRTAAQSAQDLAIWTDNGVAKGKINLGVPFSGKSPASDVPYDICYSSFIDTLSPFDPSINSLYYPPLHGTFHYVGVNLQKEKMRVAAAGGNGTMVWHHACDVDEPVRSLAVSLHDESVRHHASIDSFELPVGVSANHLYAVGSAAVTGTYTRVSGFTGAKATLLFSGAQWSNSNLISLDHPKGYAFPSGAQIRFDYKVLDAHTGISFYLRLFDSDGNGIQKGHWDALGSTGWKRAVYDRSGFTALQGNTGDFNENDVRRYQILAQSDSAGSPFPARVVFDNLVMIAPDPARRPIQDRDADGYADRLEKTMGTSAIDETSTPPTPLLDLRSWWRFDDNFSLLAEEEVQQVHGKVYGATWVEGRSGHALEFDGTDDRVVMDTTAALAGTTPFSLSVWIKTTDTDGGMILQQRDTNSTAGQYHLRCNPDGTVNFSIYNGDYQFDFASTNSIADGSWHYVVATRNDTNGYIYIDGTLDGQSSGPLKALAEHAVAVGYDHRDQNDHLAGTLDDIRIYSRALDTADITSLFTAADTDTLNDDWEIAQYGNFVFYTASDDPDDDTLDMFSEMAFGGNALGYDDPASFTASSITNDAGSANMKFSYRRTKNYGLFNVGYQLQACDALESNTWINVTTPPDSITDDPDGTTEWVNHTIPIPEETPQQFFRGIASPQ